MPSRSPFLLSTQQDTGIQVEFSQAAVADSGTSLNTATVSLSSLTVDQFIIGFGAGRDLGDKGIEDNNAGVATYEISTTQSAINGAESRIVLNEMYSSIIEENGALTLETNASDGVAMGMVAIDNGYDITVDTANMGSTASISNVSSDDLVLIWEAYTYSSSASAPSVPSGFTNIGSGTFATGRGGNIYDASYRFSYKENASGTVSHTALSSGPNAGGVTLVVVKRVLKDYELSSYGAPDYTITSFPSTGTGVSSGANDMLVALDTTIDYAAGSGDEGLIMEAGGTGLGFAWGLDNGTLMRARAFDGGGNFRDGGTDALAAADVFVSINVYQNRFCTWYIRVDSSAYTMRLYVQVGGQGSAHPIRLLQSNTSNGTQASPYGGNTKGYGVASSVADLVGAGGTGAYEDNYTGTLDEIRYWAEAGAPDVSGFSNTYDTV